MKWSHLKPGLRLEMTPILTEGEPAVMLVVPVSQLLQPVTDPNRILVAVPNHLDRKVTWPIGSRLKVSFREPNRGVWQFNGRIQAMLEVNQISCYVICAESEPHLHQRRAHYRVRCAVDVMLKIKSPDRSVQAVTCDIGGGGVCILLDQMLPDGLSVRIRIALGNGRLFTANCRVVRTEMVQIGHRKWYKVSMQYLDIPANDRDGLIRYLMSVQRRQKTAEG